jgi:hypothetical protein
MAIAPAFAHSVKETDEAFLVEHSWKYKSREWTCHLEIRKDIYNYYRNDRTHMSDSFLRYILSDYDRSYIRDIVKTLRQSGKEAGYTDYDNVMNVVAFVQSLTYMSDYKSTGQKDYVRYPLETIVDGGGDCEDTSVLIAAILNEMGYGVLLVLFPNHLALAIKGDETLQGIYYLYDNERYYYLETTDSDWNLGEIPDKYKRSNPKLIQIKKKPLVYLKSYEINSEEYDRETVVFRVTCSIENTGPSVAHNVNLYVTAMANKDKEKVWAEKMVELGDFKETDGGVFDVYLRVPRNNALTFGMTVAGDDFDSQSMYSKTLNVE